MPSYRYKVVGQIGSGLTNVVPTALNNERQVVGSGANASGHTVAFLFSNGSMQELGVLPSGHESYANAINDAGIVVGTGDGAGSGELAFRWEQGTMTALGTLGGVWSTADVINKNGQIAGMSPFLHDELFPHTYVFTPPGPMTAISVPPGVIRSSVAAINDGGQVAGTLQFDSATYHAFIYTAPGPAIDLQTLGGQTSYAIALNSHGRAVGHSEIGSGPEHAFAFTTGSNTIEDLGTLGGQNSYATDINDDDVIVGYSDTPSGGQSAFVYTKGPMQSLTVAQIHGQLATKSKANAINNQGVIVGSATYGPTQFAIVGNAKQGMQDLNPLVAPMRHSVTFVDAMMISDRGHILALGTRRIGQPWWPTRSAAIRPYLLLPL